MSADTRLVAVQRSAGELQTLPPLTTQMIVDRREQIREAINTAMVEGVHYGLIPGTNQLSLLKEGAEMLLAMFHIAVQPIVTDMCTPTEVRFQVECRGIIAGTDTYVGSGMGVCTSNEEKYRWRKARSEREYEAAAPEHRRIKYTQRFEDKQVRQSPYDVFQTIMSMAKKRAMVDLAKTALAASECLKGKQPGAKKPDIKGQVEATRSGQTAKDQPVHTASGGSAGGPGKATATAATGSSGATSASGGGGGAATPTGKGTPAQAASAPAQAAGPKLIDSEQVETLGRMIDRIGVPETEFLGTYEINAIEELEADRFEAAISWLARME